jgi:arabinofuranan 3-O-arabinosyltransferase
VIHAPALPPGTTRPPPGPPAAGPPSERIRGNIRLVAFGLLLAVLPFVTAPGRIIADTKLDLVVNPVGFLARALTLWDPQEFGQLQDQAYGYLFPMGPFFALGKLAALEPWVIQRLWIGAVLVAAFLGTVRLADRLGIGTPWAQLTAGLAYALSPAALTLLGELSAEFLPAALLPWILLPLVGVTRAGLPGNPRPGGWRLGRAAARSAAAVALCGGINAAATIAVLLPPTIYLLTLPRHARRWRLLAWWVPAVVAATWWWSIPLLLLSKYAVSIVPYTESAAVTTSVTSLSDILRGTENWVSYLAINGQPWWPLGFRIATGALPTLATGLAAGLGLAGLVSRGLPARRFLLCSLLAGVLLISAGYRSSLGAPLAGPVDQLINGVADAFRNVRKFDPMIRLPLALGLAQLLASIRLPRLRAWVGTAAGLAIAGLALPAYLSGLAMPGAFSQVPPYWVSAADWLTAHAGRQAVLVVPGAPFSQYTWGSPLDDVLQPLTSADWAERDLSIIGSPGNERLLDAIDQRLAAGDGSAGLTQVLARMGVKYLVVRNDLDRSVLSGDWPARIHQALAASPGITQVAQFGRYPMGSFTPNDAVTNFDAPYPPVQIYRVARTEPVATTAPAGTAVRVYGAPEGLLTLADEGLLGPGPVLLDSDDPGQPAAASVLTDSLRRRVRNFGELRTSYSPTLTTSQPAQTFEASTDYTQPGWDRYQSVARYGGIADVTASSSDADVGAIPAEWASGLLPYAAVDGDPRTMWETGSWTGPLGQWIQLSFRSPVDPPAISVAFAGRAALGPPVSQVAVSTAAGQVVDRVRITGRAQLLRVPRGPSGWLRITVTKLAARPSLPVGAQVGITSIAVPGVSASRTIVAPALPARTGSSAAGTDPSAVVLAKAQPHPSACMRTSLRWVCSPALATPTEEQYGFSAQFAEPAAGRARLRGSAVLLDPALIERYARFGRGHVWVTASSTYTADPQDQPWSAFDGDRATSWIASATDAHPTLHIRWWHARRLRRITIQRPPGAAGLLQVLLMGSRGQVRGGMVGPSGVLRFAPLRTDKLTITFTPLAAPLQVSGVRIPGVRPLNTPSVPLRLRCGLGPLIEFNGKVAATRVSGTFADLLTGQPMRFTGCARLRVAAGANQVTEPSGDGFDVQDAVLAGAAARPLTTTAASPGPAPALTAPGASAAAARIVSWADTRRLVQVSAANRSYLVLNQNFNPGWQASMHGHPLPAARIDGWKQAWLLPAGTSGTVTLTYPPQAPYRAALIGGLATLALVLLAAWWPAAWWPGARGRRTPRQQDDAPRDGPRPARPEPGRPPRSRRLARVTTTVGMVIAGGGVLVTGFWLGGYPGIVILAAVTGLFLFAVSYRHAYPWCRELSKPWVLTALLVAAAAGGPLGQSLLQDVRTGVAVTGAWNAIPQIICLIVVGRLAAALILPDP